MRDDIKSITAEIAAEREAQVAKWGQQDHPSTFGESDRREFARKAKHWKQVNDARAQLGTLAWDGILLEEVFEALEEVDPLLRRAELIQVAAVAAAEVEAIDRLIASDESPYAEAPVVEVEDDEEDAA